MFPCVRQFFFFSIGPLQVECHQENQWHDRNGCLHNQCRTAQLVVHWGHPGPPSDHTLAGSSRYCKQTKGFQHWRWQFFWLWVLEEVRLPSGLQWLKGRLSSREDRVWLQEQHAAGGKCDICAALVGLHQSHRTWPVWHGLCLRSCFCLWQKMYFSNLFFFEISATPPKKKKNNSPFSFLVCATTQKVCAETLLLQCRMS